MNTNFTYTQLRRIRNKRSGKVMRRWGWVLTVLGSLMALDINAESMQQDIAYSVIFLVAGVFLLIYVKMRTKKWDTYEALIHQRGNTPISYIAQQTGKSKETVRNDVQKMITNNFFIGPEHNIEAYISGKLDMIVMCIDGVPLEDIKEYEEAVREDEIRRNDSTVVNRLKSALDETEDEDLRGYLEQMIAAEYAIEKKIKDTPRLAENNDVKKLHSNYVPKAVELIEKYNASKGSEETLKQVKDTIATFVEAYDHINMKLSMSEDLDTLVDAKVLKSTLEREGLVDSEFDM